MAVHSQNFFRRLIFFTICVFGNEQMRKNLPNRQCMHMGMEKNAKAKSFHFCTVLWKMFKSLKNLVLKSVVFT